MNGFCFGNGLKKSSFSLCCLRLPWETPHLTWLGLYFLSLACWQSSGPWRERSSEESEYRCGLVIHRHTCEVDAMCSKTHNWISGLLIHSKVITARRKSKSKTCVSSVWDSVTRLIFGIQTISHLVYINTQGTIFSSNHESQKDAYCPPPSRIWALRKTLLAVL